MAEISDAKYLLIVKIICLNETIPNKNHVSLLLYNKMLLEVSPLFSCCKFK
jgi:hypothetical protein